jgi:hypothetical protein
MNVYVACGLTHVPRGEFQAYVALIHRLAASIRAVPSVQQVRYALVDSDPQLAAKTATERPRLCYLWDKKMVEDADVVVAELTHPSTGVGIELQIAECRETPLILLYSTAPKNRADPVRYVNPDAVSHDLQIGEGYLSLMILGLPGVVNVIGYSSEDEAVARTCDAVRVLARE